MITPLDKEYKNTKRIKQGRRQLAPPFGELAEWIGSKWNATVLNVIYESANSPHVPRLEVILEHEHDVEKFQWGRKSDPKKRDAIAAKFLEIIERDNLPGCEVDGQFVVFSAFAPLAKQEADSQLTEAQIKALQIRIGNPHLWLISRNFGNVTFFFYTDEQVRQHEGMGQKEVFAKMYFEILKPHDEFGYLQETDFTVIFDSKQNFNKKYHGNWFFYYK